MRYLGVIFTAVFALVFASVAMAGSDPNKGTPSSVGVQFQPDVIIAPAGGIENTASEPLPAAAAASPYVCYHTGTPSPLMASWGTWPFEQRVYETRNWCGYLNDYQTWRVSSAQLGATYCNPSGPWTTLTAGGNGYFYATVLSAGHFGCPSKVPPLNVHDWQKWRCNMAGYCAFVDAGRF
jgi:hypothetical protein